MGMAGILPMGASFLELFFIFSSVWGGVFFYGFFFLFLTFTILITTSGLVALIFAYFSFVAEDHRWHWRAFFNTASAGIYMFLYATFFFMTRLQVNSFVSTTVYFVPALAYPRVVAVGFHMDSDEHSSG